MPRFKRRKSKDRKSIRSGINEERMEWYERIKSIDAGGENGIRSGFADRAILHKDYLRDEVATCLPKRPRNYRIRDFGRRLSSDSDTGNNDFQAEDTRTLECDNNRHTRSLTWFLNRGKDADAWFKRALMGKLNEGHGQSSVEYALISVAFLSIVLGIGALSDILTGGVVVSHAISAASHGTSNAIGGAIDVFSF